MTGTFGIQSRLRVFAAACMVVVLFHLSPADAEAPAAPPQVDHVASLEPAGLIQSRAPFLQAAGADMQLTAEELGRVKAGPLAAGLDRWAVVVRFDRDGNVSIDWFEFQAYRQALHAAAVARFDTNKDGRLLGAERDAANAALAGGRVTPTPPAQGRPAVVATPPAPQAGPASSDRASSQAGGAAGQADGSARQDPRERFREMIQKHDKDGDGELNAEERAAAREDMRQQFMKQFDTNGNGEIDDDERSAVRDHFRQQREQMRNAWRQRMVEQYDKDGDGELSEAEREAARQAQRDRMAERRRQFVERFDTDGDGELSEQERQAAREAMRENGWGRGGRDRRSNADGDSGADAGRGPEGERRRPGRNRDQGSAEGE